MRLKGKMRVRGWIACAMALLLGAGFARWCAAQGVPASVAPARTLLPGGTLYPRVLRLKFGPGAGTLMASTNGVLFGSADEGAHWTGVGKVPVAEGSKERCCATLYEVPQRVGSLVAGTLLSSASYFSGGVPAIEIYQSVDGGRTWTLHSTPVVRGGEKHGLWEPEFSVAKDGALVMFWSDETDPCCSQKLVQMRTYDGVTWRDERDTVRGTDKRDRPGMIVVSKLPDGCFFMSYEYCGPAACAVFLRTSADGWDYGGPEWMGTRVQTAAGQYLEHAPWSTWMAAGGANGTLLLAGQVLYEADGSVSALNGRVLLVNSRADGAGVWSTVAAPVAVPGAYDNYCPNYSSALLPSADGRTVLELASDYDAAHHCVTYFARGPLR